MKKPRPNDRKLAVRAETLRVLDHVELHGAAGGELPTITEGAVCRTLSINNSCPAVCDGSRWC